MTNRQKINSLAYEQKQKIAEKIRNHYCKHKDGICSINSCQSCYKSWLDEEYQKNN